MLVNWYRALSVVKFQYVNKRGGTLWKLVEPCGTFSSAILVINLSAKFRQNRVEPFCGTFLDDNFLLVNLYGKLCSDRPKSAVPW